MGHPGSSPGLSGSICLHRLSVRTPDCQSGKRGSILRGGGKRDGSKVAMRGAANALCGGSIPRCGLASGQSREVVDLIRKVRGFESRPAPFYARLAHQAEQQFCKLLVVGSSPASGSRKDFSHLNS